MVAHITIITTGRLLKAVKAQPGPLAQPELPVRREILVRLEQLVRLALRLPQLRNVC